MSRIVFRNQDTKSIVGVINEMGKGRYDAALVDAGVPERPNSSMGFYFQFDPRDNDITLHFRYPSRIEYKLLSVNGFWWVPKTNWKMVRIED